MKNSLLSKMRKIHSLLQISGTDPVVFDDMCNLLGRIVNSNVAIISKKGKVLGFSKKQGDATVFDDEDFKKGESVEQVFGKMLLTEIITNENVRFGDFAVNSLFNKEVLEYNTIIVPMMASGDRIGTLFVYKEDGKYGEEEIILAEYGATVIGLEILRTEEKENSEQVRKETVVKSAIGTLSYSELEAVLHIFDELEGTEGLLVASKIADKVGITRSVIVNALRKFESAGVVECRSLGMKGTYIKVLNDLLLGELEKKRSN